jgi:CheY-like chemotaxis protein
MPIVDGLTSTKMIRSFEKTHRNILNPRAALCGRVPIIAVSASLIEKSRQMYIDAGFDAWILKPVSFSRLSELMTAIVDSEVRNECLYQPGEWEKGGWFHAGLASARDVSTVPSETIPQSGPTNAAQEAAASDDPMAGEDHEGGTIPDEQERLLQNEAKDIQPPSAPLEDEDKTPMPTPGED